MYDHVQASQKAYQKGCVNKNNFHWCETKEKKITKTNVGFYVKERTGGGKRNSKHLCYVEIREAV